MTVTFLTTQHLGLILHIKVHVYNMHLLTIVSKTYDDVFLTVARE